MQSKITSKTTLLVFSLTLLGAGGCVTGGGLTLRNTSDTLEHQGASYSEMFSATRDALDELGITLRSSRDQRLIVGQIPPFKVKAVFEPESSEVHLEAVELDRNCWDRDSLAREWVRACEGNKVRRKGVNTMDIAITQWTEAVRARIQRGRAVAMAPASR